MEGEGKNEGNSGVRRGVEWEGVVILSENAYL